MIQNSIDRILGPFEADARMVVFLGGASKGAERIAADHITSNLDLDYILFKPYNYVDTRLPHDPKYFYFRNKQIVDNADLLIVFDDGSEHNLGKTINYLINATHKDYCIVHPDGTVEERKAND